MYRIWSSEKSNITTLVPEYDTVHGRILAVNMAHLRKKRQTAENGTATNRTTKNAFHLIEEANGGK